MIYRVSFYRELVDDNDNEDEDDDDNDCFVVDEYGSGEGGHRGYQYFGSKAEAVTFAKEIWSDGDAYTRSWKDLIDKYPQKTPKNKNELLNLLNRWASHPDNE